MSVSEPRSGQMDHRGRVWAGFRIRRDEKQPAFCRSGSTNKFAKYFPLDPRPRSNIGGKQTGFFDPKTQQWTLIDTCWWFDHNDFVEDADNTLYSGMNDVLGWINTRVFDETGDEQAAQGWCPAVLDRRRARLRCTRCPTGTQLLALVGLRSIVRVWCG